MPGANPNLGKYPGRITNAQQAEADARVASSTAASNNKVAPNESEAETTRLRNSKPIVASPAIERKTEVTAAPEPPSKFSVPKDLPLAGVNVLNGFRSFNYNLTLSALKSDVLADPKSYRHSNDHYTILKSGGKGVAKLDSKGVTDAQAISLINTFNKVSPGRFDMFIDNVEIDTIMSQEEGSSASLVTKIRFDVFEPHSINGFIEAIHIAAVAAGYPNYAQASFMLKMDFLGYPDGEGMPDLVNPIPKSTRYFVFKFTGVSLDITESGAKYKCAGVPWEQSSLTDNENKLNQSVQIQGNKVGDILVDFMAQLTEQRAKAENAAGNPTSNRDIYTIEFPSWVDGKGFDSSKPNKNIIDQEFAITLRENSVFAFDDPQTTTRPNAYKIYVDTAKGTPGTDANGLKVVSFSSGQNISDCIAAVIADSHYTRLLLSTLASQIDEYGMVDYFGIRTEVTNQPIMNDQKKRYYQNIKFVVTPWKIPYNRIPNYQDQIFNKSKLQMRVMRDYNYIYTGKNVDVLTFKLHFNNAYFDAMSNAMANNDRPSAQTSAATNASSNVRKNSNDTTPLEKTPNAVPTSLPDHNATTGHQGVTGNQQQQDPYFALSRALHNSITHSVSGGMIRGEIDILGDPFFLATGGIGNYKPTPEKGKPGVTTDGEIFLDYGTVLIRIQFRNPEDINTLENGGLANFNENKVSFSGVYMVTKVTSTFNQGVFKQKVKIIRMEQTDDTTYGTTTATPVAANQTVTPNAENTPTAPTKQLAELTAGLKTIDATQRMLAGAYNKVDGPVAKQAIQNSIIQNAEERAAALKQIDALKKLKLTGG